MADTPQKVEVEAELDASQTVRGARQAAAALTEVIAQVGKLEKMTRDIFTGNTGSLPKQLKAFTDSLESVKALPAQLAQVQRAARNIASGGPAATMRSATVQGVISNIRNDPALQLQKIEAETNKVIAARGEIYRRVRDAMPDEQSAMRLSSAYRQALSAVGDMPEKGSKAYTQWLAKTRIEIQKFEADRTSAFEAEALKRDRIDAEGINKTFDRQQNLRARLERSEADRMNRRVDQDQSFWAKQARGEAEALNRRFTQDQGFWARQERSEAERLNRSVDRERKRAQAQSPEARQQRVAQAVQNRRDFQDYNGGADNFGSRLAFTRDFAAQAALLGSLSYAGSSAVEFQTKLKNLQAITQSTNTELQVLSKTIFDVGQNSKFSVSQIAEAATVMAQAGYSASQIAEALPSIANLATGAGASLEDAVNIVTSVLSVYDMSIERSSQVSNMLTQALNGSKLSLDQLSLGVQYAGNISADAGVSFEEMTAALGAMANAGIKSGSTLGTGLRALIQELENPSQKFLSVLQSIGLTTEDVDVKSQGLAGALQNLQMAGFNSGSAMNTFEIRAASAFSALSNNLSTMTDLQASLSGTSAATDAAAVNMDTLTAQVQILGNSLTELTTVVGGPFMAMIQGMIEALNAMLQGMIGAAPVVQIFATALLSLMAVSIVAWVVRLAVGFTGMSLALNRLGLQSILTATQLGGVSAGLEVAAIGVRGFTAALASNPLTWWTVGLTLATEAFFGFQAAVSQANAKIDEYAAAANTAKAETEKYNDRASEITATIETLIARHANLATNTTLAGQAADTAAAKFGDWGLVIDQSSNKVDVLINRLVVLRTQMAGYALAQANLEKESLQKERFEVQKAGSDNRAFGQLSAMGILNGRSTNKAAQETGLASLLKKFSDGTASDAEKLQLASGLRQNIDKFKEPGVGRSRAQIVIDSMKDPNAIKLSQIDRRIGTLDSQVIAPATVSSSGSSTRVGMSVAAARANYQDELSKINKIKDPAKKSKALADLRDQRMAEFPSYEAVIREEARAQLKDPQVASGFAITAKNQGITPEQAVYNQLIKDTGYSSIQLGAQAPVANATSAEVNAELASVKAQKAAARRGGDKAAEAQLAAREKDLTARKLQLANPDLDPLALQKMQEDSAAGIDADGQNRPSPGAGGARRAARAASGNAASSVKALERQIEVAMLDAPVNGVNKDLPGLLDKWKAARQEQIRQDSAAAGGDTTQRLADFDVEAKEYFNKVLDGNLQAAKDMIARADQQVAEETSGSEAARLLNGGDGLNGSLQDIQTKWATAMKSAMDAADQEILSAGGRLDSGKAIEQRKNIQRDFIGRTIEATLKAIEDYFTAQERELETDAYVAARSISAGRTNIAKLSNYYGNKSVGDVQRLLGAEAGRKLDEQEARNAVSTGQGRLDLATQKRDALNTQLAGTTDQAGRTLLSNELAEANANVEQLSQNLDASRDALEAMTGIAPQFSSYTEAMSGAWEAFRLQVTETNIYETMADGFKNAFDAANQSFSTLIKDVLTGNKSMSESFRDFTLSVLDALMDMAVKMLANKLLQWAVNLIMSAAPVGSTANPASSFNGFEGGTSTSFSMASGGEIPGIRMAGGGEIAPFRDNVNINAMPGEFLLRKSAVDMVGLDNLRQINAMGNSRMSAMPNLAQAMPQREGDEVNVWVVSPEKQPAMGKKDVLAIIGEDILTNGDTKKLIKSVVTGGL